MVSSKQCNVDNAFSTRYLKRIVFFWNSYFWTRFLSVLVSFFCTFLRNIDFILDRKHWIEFKHPHYLFLQQGHLIMFSQTMECLHQLADVVPVHGRHELPGALAPPHHVAPGYFFAFSTDQVLETVSHQLSLQWVYQHCFNIL